MDFHIDEYLLKGYDSWFDYGYQDSKAQWDTLINSGMTPIKVFNVLKDSYVALAKEENLEMTDGRLAFLVDVFRKWLKGITKPPVPKPPFPRTASTFEQEGYNFASFVHDREMERFRSDLRAIHAYMTHQRGLLLNEMPITNRKSYEKGYRRFCGELAEQLSTHDDVEQFQSVNHLKTLKDRKAFLKQCVLKENA
ncbi:MAG: hypothetical protein HEQ32_01775 [Vampirovibrio sp.]